MKKDYTTDESSKQLKINIDIPVNNTQPAVRNQYRGGKTLFLPYQERQLGLFPVKLEEMLPPDHFVFFVQDAVRHLDLSGILNKYRGKSGSGRPAYNPEMMTTLILYCYSTGVTSARRIETMITENIACRLITGNQKPDHDTIANFRQTHLEELGSLFQQILELAAKAHLVDMKTVAVDGSKVTANASKRKAMSYERMQKKVKELPEIIDALKVELSNLEGKEDLLSQREQERLQREIKFQTRRLTRIKKGKKALEKRVEAKATSDTTTNKKNKPKPGDQFNFTDPESNIMHRSGKTFDQCYNAQSVVDGLAQIIVAQDVVRDHNDKQQLVSMLLQTKDNMGQLPNCALADSGYFSEDVVTNEALADIDLFIPPNKKQKNNNKINVIGRIAAGISTADRMRRKLSTKAGKEIYKLRKCIVEPVFGQIKSSVLGFTHFSFRGLQKVKAEWALVCAAHNLLKIFRSGYRFSPNTT